VELDKGSVGRLHLSHPVDDKLVWITWFEA